MHLPSQEYYIRFCCMLIMSTTVTPAELQRQLNALQLFCEQRQLTVNLAKTKVVTFGSRARCQLSLQTFTFNGNEVERVQLYKYLGFELHVQVCVCCQQSRCVFLHISYLTSKRCKLFDSLVLPILSYTSEVWAVDKTVGKSASNCIGNF